MVSVFLTADPQLDGAEWPGLMEEQLAGALRELWIGQRPAWTEPSWWDATLREDVRELLWLPAGPDLAAALAALSGSGRAPAASCPLDHEADRLAGLPTPGHAPGWPCACLVVVAAGWEACAAWVAAGAAHALVTAAGEEPVHLLVGSDRHQVTDPAREELAHALRTSIPAMANRIGAARAIVVHPLLLDLVSTAAISGWAGRLVSEHLVDLHPDQARAVVDALAAKVGARLASGRRPYNSAEVNRIARAERLRVCPVSAQQARIRSFANRRVSVHPQADGMATLVADLDATDAHRIHRRLTSLAAGLATDMGPGGDPRNRDQMRADLLVDLLLGSTAAACASEGSAGESPSAPPEPDPASQTASGPGSRGALGHARDMPDAGAPRTRTRCADSATGPDIQVIVSLATLLGLAEDPATIPGLGPIAADLARCLAADGRWTAWIADAGGAVQATGSRGYTPSAAVARLVRGREPHCRMPGCRQPASRCDLDHTVPYPAGPTTPDNLGPLCRRHHVMKTHAGWRLEPLPTGWTWHSPAGLATLDQPDPPLP